jgi:preflagellin peptidase FlaK
MIVPLVIGTIAVLLTLLYASYRDIFERRVPFRTWYPMLIVGLPAVAWFYASLIGTEEVRLFVLFIALTAIFSLVFYLFALLHLFGGADAWALIFIALCIPAFPIEPYLGYSPTGYFPLTVLTNAVLLNLITPFGLFLLNVFRRNYAPFPYMFLGYPVPGDRIQDSFGYVMEDLSVEDGRINRRFIRVRDSIRDIFSGSDRLYTKELRLHPEKYTTELSLYRQVGRIWISYGVPFIVPITAGLITALLLGDVLVWFLLLVRG